MNRWWLIAGIAAAATLLADVFAHDEAHIFSWWHATPAFDLVFGFAGCVVIIVISKALGHWWIQRPERYYEDRL